MAKRGRPRKKAGTNANKEQTRKPGPKKEKLAEVNEQFVECPHCGGCESDIYRTYQIPGIRVKKRYRRCKVCGKNFISTQRIAS